MNERYVLKYLGRSIGEWISYAKELEAFVQRVARLDPSRGPIDAYALVADARDALAAQEEER